LVVLAILGILLLMAFPVLKPLFTKTYSLEARTNLKHLASLQETYYLERMAFTDDFQALAFEQPRLVTEESGTAHYQFEIVKATQQEFVARATSVTDFDGDGTFNVWEVDKSGMPREIIPD
ncbi:MAG: type IV pilin protein, partial [Bacteroidota bacterium]